MRRLMPFGFILVVSMMFVSVATAKREFGPIGQPTDLHYVLNDTEVCFSWTPGIGEVDAVKYCVQIEVEVDLDGDTETDATYEFDFNTAEQ